jgi:transposase
MRYLRSMSKAELNITRSKKYVAKYNDERRAEILTSLEEGMSLAETCKLHNVSDTTVKRWKRLIRTAGEAAEAAQTSRSRPTS